MKKLLQCKFIIIIVAMIVVVLSGYALATIISPLKYLACISAMLFLWPVFDYVFLKRKKNVHTKMFTTVAYVILLAAIAHFKQGDFFYYALLGCYILTAFGFTIIYSFKGFVKLFLHIMTVVSIVALIGYVVCNFIIKTPFLPTANNVNDVEYAIAGIFYSITKIPRRNCGIFWEPGLFATFLIYAIVFELIFKNGKPNIFRLLLFTITLITAQSAAGFALLPLAILLWLVQTFHHKVNKKVAIWLIVGTAVVVIIACIVMQILIQNTSLINYEQFEKLLLKNIFSSKRMQSIGHNMRLFFSRPLFGVGTLAVVDDFVLFADTSTSTYMLRMFGIGGIVYTTSWVYAILKLKNLHIVSRIILLMIVIFIVNKEPHMFNLFSWIFMFYLLKKAAKTKKSKMMKDYSIEEVRLNAKHI